MSDLPEPKGVKTKLFGVSLIILGWLNLMVSWRGSLEASVWQILILGAGIAIFALGAAKGASHTQSGQSGQSDGGERI